LGEEGESTIIPPKEITSVTFTVVSAEIIEMHRYKKTTTPQEDKLHMRYIFLQVVQRHQNSSFITNNLNRSGSYTHPLALSTVSEYFLNLLTYFLSNC